MQKNDQEQPISGAPDVPTSVGIHQTRSTSKITKQLSLAQKKMVSAKKTSTNPFFDSKYADLSSVIAAVHGPLTENGISYTSSCDHLYLIGGMAFVDVITTLRYENEYIECTVPIPLGAKPNAHAMGSALTYGRRYGLSAVTGCPAEDDDANTISAPSSPGNRVYNTQGA